MTMTRTALVIAFLLAALAGYSLAKPPEGAVVFKTELKPLKSATDSQAKGEATFWLSADSSRLWFEVSLWNVSEIQEVALYPTAKAVPGHEYLFIFQGQTGPAPVEGMFIRHSATSADLTQQFEDRPMTEFLHKIEKDGVYLTIKTIQFPDGELQGMVK